MQRVTYYVMRIGDHWEVSCSLHTEPPVSYPDRYAAQRAAEAAALALWKEQHVATAVAVAEDSGGWYDAATFGNLLDF